MWWKTLSLQARRGEVRWEGHSRDYRERAVVVPTEGDVGWYVESFVLKLAGNLMRLIANRFALVPAL